MRGISAIRDFFNPVISSRFQAQNPLVLRWIFRSQTGVRQYWQSV